jgi:hypothetical protein
VPRPIIGVNSRTSTTLSTEAVSRTTRAAPALVAQRLRAPRSKAYVEALAHLDAGTRVADSAALSELLARIGNEFPELTMADLPLGIVAKCYLGEPYEVHILDVTHGIVEHFERGRPLPGGLERARALANHDDYAFVEVYTHELRPVRHDGVATSVGTTKETV